MRLSYTFGALVAFTAFAVVPGYANAQEDQQSQNPPWSMADKYWGAEEMEASRKAVQAANGAQSNYFFMADRLEIQSGDEEDTVLWDLQGWYGGDINKLWVKSEGEYSLDGNEIEDAELQVLWSRAVSTYFDVQTGIRYDIEPDGLAHGVVGVQGLAPYWFEVDAAAFLSEKGDVTARIEAEYDMLFTQRLVLQPRVELELSAQDIPEREIGSGVTGLDAGLRLRYEIKREFAPYVGVEWQSAFGDTADFIEAEGRSKDQTVFVLGLRAWF